MHTSWSPARAVILTFLLGLAAAAPTSAAEPPPTGVYIVRVLATPERVDPPPCPGAAAAGNDRDVLCIDIDVHSRMRTEVVQVISGPDAGPDLTFRVADHYGLPKSGYFDHALVFVAMRPGDPWLLRYQEVPLLRLADGGWATCGPLRDTPARPLTYADDLGTRTGYAQSPRSGIIPPGSTRLRNGRVECVEGVRVEDVYTALRAVHLARGGAPLPEVPPGFAR